MRRILPILSFILLIAISSNSQSGRPTPPENAERIVKLYPNPATSYITFDLQKGYQQGMSVQLYSFLGRKMHEIPNAGQKTTVDLSNFTRGNYMYHLVDATGRVIETGKFQVVK